ncbi:uncharacterized protein BDR25DRAFT_339421 [Lindgomyces ingoldianus]|uniref:Uncharacterized protein n=1 Tax=Lindgomyces ingoldianus TaxID=673940 RepID=A0ACB6RBI2_9PLEO|nr:uncharacterized protein BDR25DRAFT_339421 [Lindgomyces ingoldianus]KAF2476400.1 hypothetical protein BDR25DRAFT_339421 [Lindgomyces ingoldianus]
MSMTLEAKQEKAARKVEKAARKERKRLAKEAAAAIESPAEEVVPTKEKKTAKKRKLEGGAGEDAQPAKKTKKTKERDVVAAEDMVVVKEERENDKNGQNSKRDKNDKKSKTRKGAQAEEELAAQVLSGDGKKRSEKAKEDSEADEAAEDAAHDTTQNVDTNGTISKKGSKKPKKDRKSLKREEQPEAKDALTAEKNGVHVEAIGDEAEEAEPGKKKDRFLVFIGNLPFKVTKEELQKYFEKVSPQAVRLMTDKDTGKPRGFAFLEFDRYDRMETCIKRYHHSVFPDGKKGRKINVELTAGGGGNNEDRKAKIAAKNEKLHSERQREREKREELEAKQQERQSKKEERQRKAGKFSKKENAAAALPLDGAADTSEASTEHAGIHPSRLAMMSRPMQSDWQSPKHRRRY